MTKAVEHETLPKLPGAQDGPRILFIEGFSMVNFMTTNLLGLPSEIPGVPSHEANRTAWRGTQIMRLSCAPSPSPSSELRDLALDTCRAELSSGQYHAAVIVDLSHDHKTFEAELGPSLQAFVQSGGSVAFPTSEGMHLAATTVRLFSTSWQPSDYYRTQWIAAEENRNHVCEVFGEGAAGGDGSFSAKACSLRGVPLDERCFGVGEASRTQSMVPLFAGRDVSRPPEPDSVAADADALEGDYDVCVATHRYGKGIIAYFGDVNCEHRTVELVAAFLRTTAPHDPVVAWEVGSRLTLHPDAYREAMAAKRAGNAAFGRGETDGGLDEAIQHYQQALACYAQQKGLGVQREEKVNIWSNLAECYLRQGEWTRAEESATEALLLDERHAKSLLRRAKASITGWRGLSEERQKLMIAREDLQVLVGDNVNVKTTKKLLVEVDASLEALGDADQEYNQYDEDYYDDDYDRDDDSYGGDYDGDYDDCYDDLIAQGVMPWDDDAGDVLAALHG